MRLFRPAYLAGLAAALVLTATAAESPAPRAAENADADARLIEEIVVVAERIVGGVDAPQPVILELDQPDIAAYGVGSLEELVAILETQTGSSRGRSGGGRPAFLVNGVRIASFRELRAYPPEALERVEVLTEEVAQRYGFPPDQRVINFVLKERFASREVELEYGRPGDGGYAARELEATLVNIRGADRYNLTAEVDDTSLLTEAERDVTPPPSDRPDVAGDADPTAFRSLVAETTEYALTANWTRGLGDAGGSLGLNATAEREETRSLAGLDTVLLRAPDGATALRSLGADALARRTEVDTLALGATLNTYAGAWQLTATADASRSRRDSEIDRDADVSALVAAAAGGTLDIAGPLPPLPDAGYDEARSTSDYVDLRLTAFTNPFFLPAGEASLTLDAGFDWRRIDGRDTRDTGREAELHRQARTVGFDLGLPLTRRGQRGFPLAGDVTLNLSGGVDDLSDFGTLTDWTTGLSWSVTDRLNLQVTHIVRDAAPSLAQLGEPEVANLNNPIFDFATGETALARVVTGGNPDLAAERQRDLRFAAYWDLPGLERSKLLVEYSRNRSEDVTAAFPLLTPRIEAAFPDRISRDADGRLTAVDQRPITLAEQESSRVRYGLNLRGRIGAAAASSGNRDSGRGGGSNRSGGSRGTEDQVGRWGLSLSHTIELDNKVLIADGGPRLDLLDGDALGRSGVARHTLNLEGGVFHRGFGLRVSGRYESGSEVDGSGRPRSRDLHFGSLKTLDLRLFADLGKQRSLLEVSPLFEGTRVSLRIDNVFDERRRVTDADGNVPLRYQPFLIDPVGRFVEVEVRKLF